MSKNMFDQPKLSQIGLCLLLLLLSACTQNLDADYFTDTELKQNYCARRVTIISIGKVVVNNPQKPFNEDSSFATGAMAGAALGAAAGKGGGKLVTATAGSIGGGLAAGLGSEVFGKQNAKRYIVEDEFGEQMMVIQTDNYQFKPDQEVTLITAQGVRPRIIVN